MDSEQLRKAKEDALRRFGERKEPAKVTSIPEEELTVEVVKGILENNYNRRRYVVSGIKDFCYSLGPIQAYGLSRLLPKEVLESLTSDRNGGAFSDKILDTYLKVSKNVEEAAKACGETISPEEIKKVVEKIYTTIETAFLKSGAFRELLQLIGRID